MWQSGFVQGELRRLYPSCEVEILGMSTRGDEILDVSLAKVGGKGLFVKELEAALADGRADIAVHSAKDVPMDLPEGFCLAAIGLREDPRDAFVSSRHASLDTLLRGAVVGTSSLRREAQLRERYPGLAFRALRGNLDTRLSKLDRGDYDAVVLAVAGLRRLGLGSRVRTVIEPEVSLPAAGQGALAIECRTARADLVEMLAALNDPATAVCVRAERAVSRALGGSCQLPMGAYAQLESADEDTVIWLRGLVAAPDGSRIVRAEVRGPMQAPEKAGRQLAQALLARGADAILSSIQ
jgi:hydroxymethylbilane synthase